MPLNVTLIPHPSNPIVSCKPELYSFISAWNYFILGPQYWWLNKSGVLTDCTTELPYPGHIYLLVGNENHAIALRYLWASSQKGEAYKKSVWTNHWGPGSSSAVERLIPVLRRKERKTNSQLDKTHCWGDDIALCRQSADFWLQLLWSTEESSSCFYRASDLGSLDLKITLAPHCPCGALLLCSAMVQW